MMAITLTDDTPTTLMLSDRLVWIDEHTWQPPQMSTDYGTRGDLMVHVRARQAGRPITLDGVGSNGWLSLFTVETLLTWAQVPGAQYTLHLRGTDHIVLFDASRGPAVTARPLWHLADGEQWPEMAMLPTLRFIEVDP